MPSFPLPKRVSAMTRFSDDACSVIFELVLDPEYARQLLRWMDQVEEMKKVEQGLTLMLANHRVRAVEDITPPSLDEELEDGLDSEELYLVESADWEAERERSANVEAEIFPEFIHFRGSVYEKHLGNIEMAPEGAISRTDLYAYLCRVSEGEELTEVLAELARRDPKRCAEALQRGFRLLGESPELEPLLLARLTREHLGPLMESEESTLRLAAIAASAHLSPTATPTPPAPSQSRR